MTQTRWWTIVSAVALACAAGAAAADQPACCNGKCCSKAATQAKAPCCQSCADCADCASPGCCAACGAAKDKTKKKGARPAILPVVIMPAGPLGAPVTAPDLPPYCVAMPAPRAPEPEGDEYVIETSVREGATPYGQVKSCPKLTIDEGQVGSVAINPPTLLEACAGGTSRHPALDESNTVGDVMQVRVTRLAGDRVRLDVAVHVLSPRTACKDGTVLTGKTVQAAQAVQLGKVVKLPLDKDAEHDAEHSWVELRVTKVPDAGTTAQDGPRCCPGSCCPGPCCTTARTAAANQYLAHPPLYCPPPAPPVMAQPSSAMPMPSVMAVAVPPPMAAPAPMAGAPVMPCVAAVSIASAPWTMRAAATGLELHSGELCVGCDHLSLKMAGGRHVEVAASGKQIQARCPVFRATADCLCQAEHGSQLVLQGHVHLSYEKAGQWAEVVRADRAVLSLTDGHIVSLSEGHVAGSAHAK